MKRILITTLFVALSAFFVSSVHAQSDTGNPVGVVDSATCSTISGWSYDPDYTPPVVYGCTDSSATNFNINATVDDGSCTFPQAACVSRYRWVNITAGTVDQSQGCAAAGATAVAYSDKGICASGEDRPSSGYGVAQINYSRGIWGGGNGGGGTIVFFQNGGYRCYQNGQRQDKDNTDVAVAYYCDFGSQYSDVCPADNPPPPPRSSGGGGGGCFTSETAITMADGNSKPVSSLVSGDVVRGETSDNLVVGVKQVLLGDRPLYSINGSNAFVTAGHPFKTNTGWKSIDPAETSREGVDISVTKLEVGDVMVTAGGSVEVDSIVPHVGDSSMVLYNPMLDGDHTYYANGFLVHNKLSTTVERQLLNVGPKSFFEALAKLFKPLMVNAASSDSNSVLIYDDNGTLVDQVPANIYRGDVNAVMGITGNHGFSWTVPQSLRDNVSHNLYFFGTNTDGAGKDSELSGSPATIQCAPPTNNPPSTPSLSCPPNGSYTDTNLQLAFTSSDPEGNGVRYLVDWDNDGSTDQIVPGGFAPSGSQQSAYRSWSTAGQKTVSVTTEDDQGALSSGASCSFNLVPLPPEPTCQDPQATNYGGSLPCTYPPTQTCQDNTANNFGGALPCTYNTCRDITATNFGGALPCTYPPTTFSVSIRSSTTTVSLKSSSDSERITIYSGTTVPTETTLTQHGLEYNFNNEGWVNAGAWNDLLANQERQTNASFPATLISSSGNHIFRAYGSNNGGATYFYTPNVTIVATQEKTFCEENPTHASCQFCIQNPTDESCVFCVQNPTDPSCNGGPDGPGGSGPGSGNFCAANPAHSSCLPGSTFCQNNPSAPSCVIGFTINANEGSITPIQFLGSLTATSTAPATSSPRRIEVNPVSGFADPVSLQVVGIQSKANGSPLPAGVSASYSFDGNGNMATLTWNDTYGRYVTSYGIGSVIQVALSGAISEPYNVTIRGASVNNPSKTSDFVLTVDPSAVNPLFREI